MLTLVTGTPGAGKTLWCVSEIEKLRLESGRPVHYYGVDQLTLDWMGLEDPRDWYKCPEGSIIFLDECWDKLFPARKTGSEVPTWVEPMATHRHRGHDVFIVTQHSTQIDTFVRKMVGRHVHFLRAFGLNRSIKYEWPEKKNEVDDWDRKKANRTTFKYPKQFFGTYNSTEINTVKRELPVGKLTLIGGGLAVIPLLIYSVFAVLGSEEAEMTELDASNFSVEADQRSFYGNRSRGLPPIQERPGLYDLVTWEPRVPEIPFSAMLYDQLIVPVAYPKIAGCSRMSFSDGTEQCDCYSQQGTNLRLSYRVCLDVMENGWFDFGREDRPEHDLAPAEPNDGPPVIQMKMPGQPAADGVAAAAGI